MISALQVLTSKSIDHLKDLGGSASWALNTQRVQDIPYIVCFQLSNKAPADSYPFLIGKIDGIEISPEWDRSTQAATRYLVRFSEVIEIPEELKIRMPIWRDVARGRNPVRYGTIDELMPSGIELSNLSSTEIEEWRATISESYRRPTLVARPSIISVERGGIKTFIPGTDFGNRPGISIDEAKTQLALRYGVSTEAIEIKITF